jgi:hypothetical protein
MFAAASIALLVGKLIPNLGEPVPFARWRPTRPTLDQVLWAAIRHRTSHASWQRLLKQLFSKDKGKR